MVGVGGITLPFSTGTSSARVHCHQEHNAFLYVVHTYVITASVREAPHGEYSEAPEDDDGVLTHDMCATQ